MNLRLLSTLLLVSTHVLIAIKTDPSTGAPYLTLDQGTGISARTHQSVRPVDIFGGPVVQDLQWLWTAGFVQYGHKGYLSLTVKGREYVALLRSIPELELDR
jgi:hypothetical protein